MKNKQIRVNIGISSEIKKFFENLSKEVGAPQSALMAIALKEYIDQKKVIEGLPGIIKNIEEIKKTIKVTKKNDTEKNL